MILLLDLYSKGMYVFVKRPALECLNQQNYINDRVVRL